MHVSERWEEAGEHQKEPIKITAEYKLVVVDQYISCHVCQMLFFFIEPLSDGREAGNEGAQSGEEL